MNSYRVDILSNAGAGNGSPFEWRGGRGVMVTEATFTGGSVKLQMQGPQGNWIDVPNAEAFNNDILKFELPQSQVRAVVSAAGVAAAYCSLVKTGF